MKRSEIDPLDTQDSTEAARERFRASLGAAALLGLVLEEHRRENPNYFDDLYGRLQSGFDYIELLKDEEFYDGNVPLHAASGAIDYWIGVDDLADLLDLYFPHGPHDAPSLADGRYLVVLMLHSALECLVNDLGLQRKERESIVATVLRHNKKLQSKHSTLAASLIDLRETRNVIAHSGGIVTDRYLATVRRTKFRRGERRLLAEDDIRDFTAAVRNAGHDLLASAVN